MPVPAFVSKLPDAFIDLDSVKLTPIIEYVLDSLPAIEKFITLPLDMQQNPVRLVKSHAAIL